MRLMVLASKAGIQPSNRTSDHLEVIKLASPDLDEPRYAGKPLEMWLTDLKSSDSDRRWCAAAALWGFFLESHLNDQSIPAEVIPPLIDALQDSECGVRKGAAMALGAAGEAGRNALSRLVKQLADDSEETEVRVEVARAIADLGEAREAAPILLRLLRAESAEMREAASKAIESADLSGLNVEMELRSCLSDCSPAVRTWACWSLCRLTKEGREFVPMLRDALHDERARLPAARLLCWLKDQAHAALPDLLALQNDSNWMLRLQAVRPVSNIPCDNDVCLPVLDALRDDPQEIIRSHVNGERKRRGLA